MEFFQTKVRSLKNVLGQVIRGKDEVLSELLTGLFAGGSILLEDVPGVGKTTLVKALAAAVSADFHRVSFTPDLLPGDLLGGSVYNPRTGEMVFRPGPVFANLLLADEINRASPRTQSALLEAMSEKQISLEGRTLPLPDPFWVLATENPVEYQGTYPLPEAQLDRFAMRLSLGYPDANAELSLLFDRLNGDPLEQLQPVFSLDEIRQSQHEVRQVRMERSVASYLQKLVVATRDDARIRLGASPRALVTWSRLAQSRAWLDGRDFTTPDDVKSLALRVLPHRLMAENQSRYAENSTEEIVRELLEKVKVPR